MQRIAHNWNTQRERGSRLALRAMTVGYRLVGRRFCALFLPPIAGYFFLCSRRSRSASLDYLTRVFGPAEGWVGKVSRWWLSFLHHLEFAHALLDKFSVWQGDLTLGSFTWHDKEPLKTLLQSGKGAVVLSAHLGNIETIRAISTELQNITINALMFRAHNPHFNAVLPPSSQLRIVPTENLGPELLFDLQERVKNGEAVSMLADRLLPGSPEKGVAVQFFGSEAQFPAGPFVVASLLECPVFLVFCVRTGRDRYEVTFERFCNPLTLPRNKRQEALRDVVATFAHRLEHHTRKHPLQWFNFYDFWSLPVSLTVSPTPPPLAPSE